MREKWICPNLDVQVFTPQEYVAACWEVTLHCEGQSPSQGWEISNVYPWGTTNKQGATSLGTLASGQSHVAHDTPIIYIRTPDDTFNPDLMDTYENLGGYQVDTAVGEATGRNGKQWVHGFYWHEGGQIHFATALNRQISPMRPNHS